MSDELYHKDNTLPSRCGKAVVTGNAPAPNKLWTYATAQWAPFKTWARIWFILRLLKQN